MTSIVISQPMFFPWVGLFEQIKLADRYIHYDDVQYSKGSFTNRVQIWDGNNVSWMSVPVMHKNSMINAVEIDYRQNWQRKHIELLKQSYSKAPFQADMLDIVNTVYAEKATTISRLSITSIEAICRYFQLADPTAFILSSALQLSGKSTERVLNIVKALQGTEYITGHGAKHYLQHELFEQQSIDVSYMDYQLCPYPQLTTQFTPYISILDLVANCGPAGKSLICSGTKTWKDFV